MIRLLERAVEVQSGGGVTTNAASVMRMLEVMGKVSLSRDDQTLTTAERQMQAGAIIGNAWKLPEPGRSLLLSTVGLIHIDTAIVAVCHWYGFGEERERRVVRYYLTGKTGKGRMPECTAEVIKRLDVEVKKAIAVFNEKYPVDERVF